MEVNYMHFKEGAHIANHISNSGKVFTNKISTLEAIQNLALNLQSGQLKSDLVQKVEEFWPETYRLDVVSDLYQFLNNSDAGFWIEKKSQSNQGRGIKLIKDVQKYKDDMLLKKDEYEVDSTQLLLQKLDKLEGE